MRLIDMRWPRSLIGWVAVGAAVGPVTARAADPDPATLLAARVHPFRIETAALSGPGWEVLKAATANSQFVLLGEGHEDRQTPLFARALYRALQAAHGFDQVALEQDPLAMELACAPERRGDVRAVAALSKRYPTLFEFSSDQDLAFVDLRALRPYQRLFRMQVAEKDQWPLRDLINAFDAIVVLPEGPEAERTLTGFPKLGS